MWAGPSDSLIVNRIWPKWWLITSNIRLQTWWLPLACCMPTASLPYLCRKPAAMLWATPWKGPCSKKLKEVSSQQLTDVYSIGLTNKRILPTTTWVSLEWSLSPVVPSRATTAPANIIITASWETLKQQIQLSQTQIPGPRKLEIMFVVLSS